MKEKKPRCIRKPKGYLPGDFKNNGFVSAVEYLPGNKIVSREAYDFFQSIRSFSDLMRFSLIENGDPSPSKSAHGFHGLKSGGYNKQRMKSYRMATERVDALAHSLAWDVCEHALRAIQTGDDYFFKDIARLCKYEKNRPKITIQEWLNILHRDFGIQEKQKYYFKVSELCKLAFLRGFKNGQDGEYKPTRMDKICRRLGIETVGTKERETKDFRVWLRRLKAR